MRTRTLVALSVLAMSLGACLSEDVGATYPPGRAYPQYGRATGDRPLGTPCHDSADCVGGLDCTPVRGGHSMVCTEPCVPALAGGIASCGAGEGVCLGTLLPNGVRVAACFSTCDLSPTSIQRCLWGEPIELDGACVCLPTGHNGPGQGEPAPGGYTTFEGGSCAYEYGQGGNSGVAFGAACNYATPLGESAWFDPS